MSGTGVRETLTAAWAARLLRGLGPSPTLAAGPVACPKEIPVSKVNETVERVTAQNIESILCAEDERRTRVPAIYRGISAVTAACGTPAFLAANAAVFAAWVAFNQWVYAFDPYPFTLLLFAVSLEAIFLSILILISQNMAAAESERRHHLDLQMNLLAERELTALMRLVVDMADRAGLPAEKTAEVRSFAHETDPSGVLAQIVRAEHRHRVPNQIKEVHPASGGDDATAATGPRL